MGVAVMVKRCESAQRPRSIAFSRAPKRCSSSMIIRPRSANTTSFAASACVPTTNRIVPSANPAFTRLAPAGFTTRDSMRDLDVEGRKTPPQRFHMLAHKHGSWRDQGDLLAGEQGRCCCADRHFRFAEADIAADKPVHRHVAPEIVSDGRKSGALVRCRRVGEARGEARHHLGGSNQATGLVLGLVGRQRRKMPGRFRDRVLDLLAPLWPGMSVELVERHGIGV